MGLRGGWGGGGYGMRSVMEQRWARGAINQGGRPSWETARRLLGTLRPHRGKLAVALGLATIGVVLGLIPPLLIREIIDQAIVHRDVRQIFLLAGGLLLFPAGGALVSIGQNYLNAVVGQSVIHDLRTSLYAHGQKLGIDFFTHSQGGEIHSRLVNDLNAVQVVLSRVLTGLFVNTITLLLALAIMFSLNWQLAVVSAVALPAFAVPIVSFGKKTYDATTRTQEALSRVTAHLEETLTLAGIIVVKSFGSQRREAEHFQQLSETVRETQVAQSMVGQWLMMGMSILSSLGPALLFGLGGYLVVRGSVPLGTVVAFAAYQAQLYSPATSLAGANTTLLGGLSLFDRIFGFLELPIALPEPTDPLPFDVTAGTTRVALSFDAVTFAYNEGDEVLKEVSFDARPGELTAIVGPSGAGKSTMLALAARFYDPQAGEVRLNGLSVQRLSDDALRSAVAVVTQEIFLFHSTFEDNVRYGRPEATKEEMEEAIRAAQLADLVDTLPQGIQTVVGERGYRLSGGERQRVAIARAILRNPSVLLLDEATASLDSHAEHRVQKALESLFTGRTVVAIAHRLSTILSANQILVVQRGHIVERGRHADLLALGGLYAQLYTEQFRAKGEPSENT